MKTVALLLAKSKSNRLPIKNTLDFGGRPMFLVNLEKCLKIFDEVYVSSDSQWILDQAEANGGIPILRGEDLCGDTPNIPVYQHAVEHMKDVDSIVAVQVNSPTVDLNVIALVKHLVGNLLIDEVMTCHSDRSIYGSVWGLSVGKLKNYGDPYEPSPDVLVRDRSIDIHTEQEYKLALRFANLTGNQ